MDAAQERQYAMFLHLSALGGFIVGGLFFLGPLIMWLVKKDESAFVDRHGRAAMDFFLSILLYGFIAVAALGAIAVATLGLGVLLLIPAIIVLAIAVGVALILLPILAAFKAQKGEECRYPLSIRFLSKGAAAAPAAPPGSWPPAPPTSP
jgi:uncharacterized Tic20 family protein